MVCSRWHRSLTALLLDQDIMTWSSAAVWISAVLQSYKHGGLTSGQNMGSQIWNDTDKHWPTPIILCIYIYIFIHTYDIPYLVWRFSLRTKPQCLWISHVWSAVERCPSVALTADRFVMCLTAEVFSRKQKMLSVWPGMSCEDMIRYTRIYIYIYVGILIINIYNSIYAYIFAKHIDFLCRSTLRL